MLTWIDNNDFSKHLETLFQRCDDAKKQARERITKNVIDPFQSLIIAVTYGIYSSSELKDIQESQSAVSGISSALGDFHQNILGSVNRWHNHDAGYDLECNDRKIIAEIKNKWNTLNSTNRRQVIIDLETALRQKQGVWSGYLVYIIPKKPHRYEKLESNNLYEIDGASFYQIVTGIPDAIHDLFDEICKNFGRGDEIRKYCKEVMNVHLPPRL